MKQISSGRVRLRRRADTRGRAVVAARGPVSAIPGRTTVESSPGDDLDLTRLLSITRLSPAQAVALGADVVAGLEDRPATGRTRLCPEAVRVGRDGRARLVDAGEPTSVNGAGLASAAALLDGLRAAVRPSAADRGLISALERAATEARSPRGRIEIVAAILREVDAVGGAPARAELAGMVATVADGVAPASAADPTSRVAASRRRPRDVARAALDRGWKWVLSLVVLVAVVAIEIALLREEISRDIQAVLEAGRSGSSATGAPALPPVVPPAPAAAGTISGVDLRPVTLCTPDAACALRVQVLLQPRAEPQVVTWDFRILDRCTGAAVTVPGGTVTVPPHGDRADLVTTVGLPRADALAVLAITSQPFTAASAAVRVPATGACGT